MRGAAECHWTASAGAELLEMGLERQVNGDFVGMTLRLLVSHHHRNDASQITGALHGLQQGFVFLTHSLWVGLKATPRSPWASEAIAGAQTAQTFFILCSARIH